MKRILTLGLFVSGIIYCNAQTSRIAISDLPKPAQIFVKQHYKNRPVESVRKDGSGIPYQVVLAQGTVMKFAENGDWCEIDGDGAALPIAMVPETVASYVKTKYPKKRIKFLHRGPNSTLVNLTGNVNLHFDQKGSIIQ